MKAKTFRSAEYAADFINRYVNEIVSLTVFKDELLLIYK